MKSLIKRHGSLARIHIQPAGEGYVSALGTGAGMMVTLAEKVDVYEIPELVFSGEFESIKGLGTALLSYWMENFGHSEKNISRQNMVLLTLITQARGGTMEMARWLYASIKSSLTDIPLPRRDGAILVLLMESIFDINSLKKGVYSLTPDGELAISEMEQQYQEQNNGHQRVTH
ncbi:TPA: hypothetical protein L9W62_000055 [Klebsiella pneumoniae]|nr:hypothetical protein [Klebsiella pneumoniae]